MPYKKTKYIVERKEMTSDGVAWCPVDEFNAVKMARRKLKMVKREDPSCECRIFSTLRWST